MSATPFITSTFKKRQQGKSAANTFQYNLYECVQLLGVKKNCSKTEKKGFQENVDILISSFYERNDVSLLVLVCSNGHLLLIIREGEHRKPNIKQLNWFLNPSKKINALCIDPIRGSWVLCTCDDSSVYLIPALAQMKDSLQRANASSLNTSLSASTTDLTRVQYAKPVKGIPTCLVWWHTIDDQNVGVIGTQAGELIFLDLSQHQEICRSAIKESIVKLELLQDIHERTAYLFIQTENNWTLQLLLEQPSQNVNFTSSLTQGYDMGYDMVTDCNLESILSTDSKENKEDRNILNRIEVLPQDFNYSIHYIRDNIWIAKHDVKFSALEVFSDIKRVPEFIYHVPQQTTNVVVCTNLMFTIFKSNDQKISMALLSRHLATTAFGRQGLKKPDPTKRADLQIFELDAADTNSIIACYKSHFKYPIAWQEQFPHNDGYEDECELNSFLVVTNDGVFECKPRISPEHYFTELAVKDTEVADRLGFTFDLNVSLLCEYIGDKIVETKDIPTALRFYHLSKCSPMKRAMKIVEYGTVTDALIYIKQVLKKPSSVLSSKEKKRLADTAIACYVEQVLETQQGSTFSRNLAESFRSFLCDNFDYDEDKAMVLLVSHGMTDNLFQVGKARGKIDEVLQLLATRGCFLLTLPIQNMFLDCGYAEKVCKACEGTFIKHMQPEEQVRFLLAEPEITRHFLDKLVVLLSRLNEAPLLLIARVFDPSRQFIKQFLEKSDLFRRKRTGSGFSIASKNSTIVPEDPTVPSSSEIILMFLKTLIELNSKRNLIKVPDMDLISRHLSGQLSWTGSLQMRSDSLGSNEMVKSEVAKLRIACGRHHSAFVSSEKDLYTWGKASCGRLGHGDLMNENAASQPMRVESLHMHGIQVLSVSCGALHTVALCQEGVFAWGSNKYGQLGIGDTRRRSRPVLLSEISTKYINSIVCGHYHTLAITIDCKLYAWGWGIHGQLGLRSVENEVLPQQLTYLNDHRVIQASAGYAHSAVLTSRGLVFTFGAGIYGQLGIGSNKKHTIPMLVKSLWEDSIYLIACGAFETLAISEEQTIYCWGRNYHQFHICGKADSARYGRQMASSSTDISHRYYPEDLPFKLQQPITQLVCGNWHYVALTSVNYVYTWGCNDCGQLGHYNKIDQPAPRLVKALSRKCVTGVAAGSEFTMVMDTEEQVLAWGRADGGLIGIENEDSVTTNPVKRRSMFSVLAPSLVPGLPIHFDQVSIGSGQSIGREFLFDQHYDLPDLSSVGEGQPPYGTEAVLLSLFKLSGLYNANVILEHAKHVKQWFVLSFCYELREEWDLAFSYRMKAIIEEITSNDKEPPKYSLCDRTILIVSFLLKKFEDFVTEDVQENTSLVAMVKCILRIFDYFKEEGFCHDRLEELFRKHIDSLSPVFAIVFFGYLSDASKCQSNILRLSLYCVHKQHTSCKCFTHFFYDDLLSSIVVQLDSGTNWYTFLSCASESSSDMTFSNNSIAQIGESTLSRDDMIKEIIEHKRQSLNIKPFLTLSNAVATTLADASIAQKVSSSTYYQNGEYKDPVTDEPDSTVFSCNHNLPRYYMLETVIPEFISRMEELPEPLNHTAEVMSRYYRQSDIRIPMACPYCVYNSLRSEQMNILRETGSDTVNIKATVWEI